MLADAQEWGHQYDTDLFAYPMELNGQFLFVIIATPSSPSKSLLDLLEKVVLHALIDHTQEQIWLLLKD